MIEWVKMKPLVAISLIVLSAQPLAAKFPTDFESPLQRIAFGSCNRQDLPQPLWEMIGANEPDLFIWAGDNIYGDTTDMEVLESKYETQRAVPAYAEFARRTPIIATRDDHDYGANNSGAWYPKKKESQHLALDFADVPKDDPRRQREGLYGSYDFGPAGKRVKILLIDNRYHSDKRGEGENILGDTQMEWLFRELKGSDAQLNLIVSGTQVLPVEHRFEKWSNFPATRDKVLEFIRENEIPGVAFISGDRHLHEIMLKNDAETAYPLVEVTSSGLTHFWTKFPGEPNRYRFGPIFNQLGFGLIEIDWDAQPATVSFQLRDEGNAPVNTLTIPLVSLAPTKK